MIGKHDILPIRQTMTSCVGLHCFHFNHSEPSALYTEHIHRSNKVHKKDTASVILQKGLELIKQQFRMWIQIVTQSSVESPLTLRS